jgi:hypothetical protein
VFGTLLVAAWGVCPPATSPIAPPPLASREQHVVRPQVPRPAQVSSTRRAGLDYRPGQVLTYRLFDWIRTTVKPQLAGLDGAGSQPPGLDFEIRLVTRLRIRVYEETDRHWQLGFDLENPRVTIDAGRAGTEQSAKEFAAALEGEVLVEMEKSGRIARVFCPEDMDIQGRNHWRHLLARWQLILPESETIGEWKTQERDGIGDYKGIYARRPADSGVEVTKRREYVSPHFSTEGSVELQGGASVLLEGTVRRLWGRESLSIDTPGLAQPVVSESAFDFRLESQATQSPADLATRIQRLRVGHDALELGPGQVDPPPFEDQEIPLPERLSRLEQLLDARGGQTAGETELMADLVEVLRRSEQAVAAVLERLALEPCSDDLASVLLGALGAAGTAPAQLGIMSVATSDEWPLARRQTALFALAQVTQPVAGVFKDLETLHAVGETVSGNALLLLGAMADRVRDSEPQRFQHALAYITEVARIAERFAEQDPQEIIIGLGAIANVGPHSTPDIVEVVAKSQDPNVRLAAVESMGRIFDDAAASLLGDRLRGDTAEVVRAAAARLLASLERQTNLQLLATHLASEPSEEVRRALVMGLNERASSESAAYELLEKVAMRDPVEGVRTLALEGMKAAQRL